MAPTDSASHEFLTSKQVAASTGHSPRTVLRWAQSGRLATVRLSRHVRFRKADVERFIASGYDGKAVA